MISVLLAVLVQTAVEERTFDRAPGELVARLQHAKGVVRGNWVDRFRAELDYTSEQGNVASVVVQGVAARRSRVSTWCKGQAVAGSSCTAHVWAELGPMAHVSYEPLAEPQRRFDSDGEEEDHGAVHTHGYGGVLFGDAQSHNLVTTGPVFTGGAEIEKWKDRHPNYGGAFGLWYWQQEGVGTETAMFSFTVLVRGRIALPTRHCNKGDVECASFTFGVGFLSALGSVVGPQLTATTTVGLGLDGRAGAEVSFANHFSGLFELRMLLLRGGYEMSTGALLVGLSIR